jgi:D-alanyl-D-alanine carboxypeptidase
VTGFNQSVFSLNRFLAVALIAAAALVAPAANATRYAAIVIDDATGRVLHQVNPDAPRYPASLTKMMTLYMTFEAVEQKKLGLDQRIPVSARAAGMAPSRLGLIAGETITVRQAILGLVTKSANDAAATLGEAIGGTETNFAVLMTKRANALGMTNTTFKNASGLPNPKQITTARDMATLARALRSDFPQHYAFFKTPDFTFKGITHRNHNRLLAGFEGTDGLKTGFINASGFNLVASAVRDGRRLTGVVLGGESAGWRDARMMSLFDQGFDRTLPAGDTMMAKAAPAPRKTQPAPRPALIASAQAGSTERAGVEQGDSGGTKVAALPPNKASRMTTKVGQDWAIQVGAFGGKSPAQSAANQAKNKLPKTLKGATVMVTPSEDNGGTLYRARLMGLSEKQAQSACRQLMDRGTACITISPDQMGGAAAG